MQGYNVGQFSLCAGTKARDCKPCLFLISDSVCKHPSSLKRSVLPNIDNRVLSSQLLLTPTLKPAIGAKIHSQPALYLCRGKIMLTVGAEFDKIGDTAHLK